MSSACSVTGCEKGGRLRVGMCQMHYRRWHLFGDVNYHVKSARTNADGRGYRVAQRADGTWDWEHIVIAEKALGRRLPEGVEVHHVNLDPSDNTPRNLVICPSHAYHKFLHTRTAALDVFGNPDARKCSRCKKYDLPQNLTRIADGRHYHNQCNNAAMRAYHAKRRASANGEAA
jgi:hypothetical protein